jgi:hypothetical protein
VAGVEFSRVGIVRNGLLEIAHFAICVTTAVVSPGELGVDGDGLVEIGSRLITPLDGSSEIAELAN